VLAASYCLKLPLRKALTDRSLGIQIDVCGHALHRSLDKNVNDGLEIVGLLIDAQLLVG
jgi:hypothetical protein